MGRIAEVLLGALKIMNDKGAHWTKGTWSGLNDEGEPNYCSVGALRRFTTGSASYTGDSTREAGIALARLLPPSEVERNDCEDVRIWWESRIVEWNDAQDREWAEIVEKFREAAQGAS